MGKTLALPIAVRVHFASGGDNSLEDCVNRGLQNTLPSWKDFTRSGFQFL